MCDKNLYLHQSFQLPLLLDILVHCYFLACDGIWFTLSLSVLLKGLYVEQNKWEYTKGDRQYQIFGTFVSWSVFFCWIVNIFIRWLCAFTIKKWRIATCSCILKHLILNYIGVGPCVWSNLLYMLALSWIIGILILQSCSTFALSLISYVISCFQASEWKPVNRTLTWRARLSSNVGQTTNWREQHIRTNTHIISKPEPNKALVSVFLMFYCLKSIPQWLTLLLLLFFFLVLLFSFLFCLLWTVTWTTIRLAGKSHLSYPDYQILFTCKSVISHILIYFIISHISEQSLRLVTIINSACAAFLIITIYQGLFHQTSPNCQIY